MGLSFAGGLWIANIGTPAVSSVAMLDGQRKPAGTSITDFSPDQIAKAEFSVSPLDFPNSDPGEGNGRSYFDAVFSKVVNGKRVYDVPFPFQKTLDRINQYMGYSGNGKDNAFKVVLFPMGRSLQRNAAQPDPNHVNIDLYFRFPRVVAGVDQEPKNPTNPLALNLKGRLFVGFHERSKVIEAISYNDEAGRYEYQVIRDYEAGKTPKVVYEDRQKCLGCHQNQTPIFSEPPWNESNAHLPIFSVVERQMGSAFGDKACDNSRTQPYCFTGNGSDRKYFYYGAPTKVDQADPYALDTLTDIANFYHAYHKMWQTVCQTADCREKTVMAVLTNVLNGRQGVYMSAAQRDAYLMAFENAYKTRFPYGMKIPSPNIPNRDPLTDPGKTTAEKEASLKNIDGKIHAGFQDLISTSSVAGRLEPLMARAPIELYDSSFPTEINTNKLIEGFSDFFTAQDARVLDAWLIKSNNKAKTIKLETDCNVSQSAMPDSVKIRVSCEKFEKTGLFMENATIQVRNSDKQVQLGQIDNLYLYGASPNCSVQAIQTAENRANGSACPAIEQAQAAGSLNGDILTLQPYNVHSGVSARLIDGRLVARMQINLTTKKMEVLISDDIALLTKLVKFPETMNFNRKFVMKSIAAGLGINVEDSEALLPTLEKNVEDDEFTAEQILATYKNPVNAFYHSCGKCHYNNENVPPAFLGNKSVAASLMNRCQRIEMCAPRMLYRLKMRNCAPADIAKFQKIPMPPPYFFPVVKVADQDWQSKVAPQVIQFATKLIKVPEVVAYMVSQGVPQTVAQTTINQLTTADCPNVDYKQYENLPKCDFAQLKQNSSCGSLMSAFGDN